MTSELSAGHWFILCILFLCRFPVSCLKNKVPEYQLVTYLIRVKKCYLESNVTLYRISCKVKVEQCVTVFPQTVKGFSLFHFYIKSITKSYWMWINFRERDFFTSWSKSFIILIVPRQRYCKISSTCDELFTKVSYQCLLQHLQFITFLSFPVRWFPMPTTVVKKQ